MTQRAGQSAARKFDLPSAARAATAVLMLVTFAGLIVGCGPTTAGGRVTPTGQTTTTSPSLRPYDGGSVMGSPARTEPEEGLLPLQAYMLMGRDLMTVERALVILEQQCMDDLGFDVQLPAPPRLSESSKDLSYRRYGIESLAHAKKYGYTRGPEGRPDPDDMARLDAFSKSLSDAERTALRGKEAASGRFRNGCFGVAERQLMEGTSRIRVAGTVPAPIVRSVNIDPRSVYSPESRKAIAQFVKCMTEAGYPGLDDPRDSPAFVQADQTLTKAHITAAVTHFKCQESSGASKAMREAEVKFQLAAIEANPEAFAEVKAENATVVRRATEIVEKSR